MSDTNFCDCHHGQQLIRKQHKDTMNKEETFTLDCPSFKKRQEEAKKGKIYFNELLHLDFFHSSKLLLPGCEIKLKFIRNADTFGLLGTAQLVKIKIHSLKLFIRRIAVKPEIVNRIEQQLKSTPAIYPQAKSKIQSFTVNKDVNSTRISNVFNKILPRTILVTFVDTKAFDGNISKNPFFFQHFKLNRFQVYINGEPLLKEVFQPYFTKNNYYRE